MGSKTPLAIRDFKDAGTERSFKAGEPVTDVEDGELENYRAAGLVTDSTTDAGETSASVAPATKPARAPRKRTTKSAASKLN